jgi:hypothetical protein
MAEDQDMDELVEAALNTGPPATEPVSPLVPEVQGDEFKYIQGARQQYIDTGRPPRGFGVRVYGDRILVRRFEKKGS